MRDCPYRFSFGADVDGVPHEDAVKVYLGEVVVIVGQFLVVTYRKCLCAARK